MKRLTLLAMPILFVILLSSCSNNSETEPQLDSDNLLIAQFKICDVVIGYSSDQASSILAEYGWKKKNTKTFEKKYGSVTSLLTVEYGKKGRIYNSKISNGDLNQYVSDSYSVMEFLQMFNKSYRLNCGIYCAFTDGYWYDSRGNQHRIRYFSDFKSFINNYQSANKFYFHYSYSPSSDEGGNYAGFTVDNRGNQFIIDFVASDYK